MLATEDLAHPIDEPCALTQLLPRGVVTKCTLAGGSGYEYLVYVPADVAEGAPVLVSVHGISRNARAHATAFSEFADRYGVIIVAPLFTEQQFPGYQRLGISSRRSGPRPDLVLNAMLEEIEASTGARTDRFYLFGYSGGGQFAHRYAMSHPERVIAVAMGAPGWYTFPDDQTPYPRGMALPNGAPLATPRPESFLRVPMAVFVGEHDNGRDRALRQTRGVDAQQGLTRLERGRRWVDAMRKVAQRHGYDTRYEFNVLADCGHSFRGCMRHGGMGWQVFEFLFGHARERRRLPRELALELDRGFLVFNAA